MASKPSKPSEADLLNERARLYPWMLFNQGEIELMTSLPRQAVAAAFDAGDVPAQFGRSRPEDIFTWVRKQDAKIQTKQAGDIPKEAGK